jgi:DNA-binding MarR family transcriptional regulator
MSEQHLTTGRDIARALRRAYALMHRQTQSLLLPYDTTADQYVLLALLNMEDGVTQNEITLRASSDPNTVRAMLVLMEEKGLVVRRPHDKDRRARRVFITPRGRRLHAKLVTVLKPLQDALLAPLDERQAGALTDYLERIAEAMRQWELRQKGAKAS